MPELPLDREYHVSHNGVRFGPVSGFDLSRRRLTAGMRVWWQGLPDWIPVESVPELAPYVTFKPVHPTMVPPRVRIPELFGDHSMPPPLPGGDPGGACRMTASADRGSRLAAALVDGIIVAAILWPLVYVTGSWDRMSNGQATPLEEGSWALVGGVVFLLVHGHLLVTRGQTVGKYLMGIQIVSAEGGQLLPFVRVVVYRYWWMLPATILSALIPGPLDNAVISCLGLVDVLFIFGSRRRCLHDYIAGSTVVQYQPDRPRLE
jgi:uncharacterized RDD family membrane protein YckC